MSFEETDYSGVAIGEYEVLKQLGKGGMGVVYLARHRSLDRLVALKLLPPQLAADKEYAARFLREARAAAKLNHPHIIQIYDFGKTDQTYYFVMEYVPGKTLGNHLHVFGPFEEGNAIAFLRVACTALDAAHNAGIIHRDIKPDNFLVAEDGTVKLGDLGLARVAQEESSLTMTGAAMGTPFYISPEQVRGDKNIDGRTDIYSLGATMYHVLTGEVPFKGSSAAVIMAKHLSEPFPWPKHINPKLSDSICQVIAKMMAKDRDDRYANAAEVAADLDRLDAGQAPFAAGMPAHRSTVLVPTENPLHDMPILAEPIITPLPNAAAAAQTIAAPPAKRGQKLVWMLGGACVAIVALFVLVALPKIKGKARARRELASEPLQPTAPVAATSPPEGFTFDKFFPITDDATISAITPNGNFGASSSLVVGPNHAALLHLEPTFVMEYLRQKMMTQGGFRGEGLMMLSRVVLTARQLDKPVDVSVYLILKPWQPATITWLQAQPNQLWKLSGASALGEDRSNSPVTTVHVDAANKAYVFEITEAMRDWRMKRMRNESVSAHGWLLATKDTGSVAFSSSECPLESDRPKLEIYLPSKKQRN